MLKMVISPESLKQVFISPCIIDNNFLNDKNLSFYVSKSASKPLRHYLFINLRHVLKHAVMRKPEQNASLPSTDIFHKFL